ASRRELVYSPAGGVAASESDVRDLWMRYQRLADFTAQSRDHIDHAVRDARFCNETRELEHGSRCVLRWFDDDRATGRERRRELPACERERRVPGRDDRYDAFGLVFGVCEYAFLVGRRYRAFDLVR